MTTDIKVLSDPSVSTKPDHIFSLRINDDLQTSSLGKSHYIPYMGSSLSAPSMAEIARSIMIETSCNQTGFFLSNEKFNPNLKAIVTNPSHFPSEEELLNLGYMKISKVGKTLSLTLLIFSFMSLAFTFSLSVHMIYPNLAVIFSIAGFILFLMFRELDDH